MSSFLVSDEHITMMVSAAVRYGGPGDPFSYYWDNPGRRIVIDQGDWAGQVRVGRMLRRENVAGQRARYGDDDGDPPYVYPANAWMAGRQATVVEVLKGISCYEYQACESATWETSEAKRFCEALQSAAIRHLPGYEDAPWEYNVKPADQSHIRRLM